MWIIVATVLLLYLLGFLFICFLNAENHGNPSSVDNNSLSASTNHDETENFCQRHHLSRYHRLFLNRLLSPNFRFDEESGEANRLQAHSQTSGGRQEPNSSDPSRSALFAHRQQQLRQIHHEINEMSHLLGARQSQPVHQSGTVSVPIFSRANLVQPLRNFGSSSNYFNVYSRANCSRYSFVHQLMSPPQSPHCSTTTRTSVTTGESAIMSSNPGTNTNNVISSNSGISTPGGSMTYHSCGSSSLSYSPSGSESCHIFQARQRRLRDIRMELEGLSLQLSHVDDPSASGITGMSPPQEVLHQHRASQASDSSSNLLMRGAAPSSAGTTLGIVNNLEDSASSLIYFGRGNASIINGSSWSDDNDDDDLPGYESIVCLVESRQRVDGTSRDSSSVENTEESPPPSYNDVVHLYSFERCAEAYKGQRCDTKDIPNSGSYLSYFCIFGTNNPDYPC